MDTERVKEPTFSPRRFFVWLCVSLLLLVFQFLLLASLFSTVTMGSAIVLSTVSFGIVIFGFAVVDLFKAKSGQMPRSLIISYFTTAISFAIAVSFVVLLVFHEPTSEHSENLLIDIGLVIVVVALHFFSVGLLSTVGFVIAVAAWRKHPRAKWLTFLNIPGLLLGLWVIFVIVSETVR